MRTPDKDPEVPGGTYFLTLKPKQKVVYRLPWTQLGHRYRYCGTISALFWYISVLLPTNPYNNGVYGLPWTQLLGGYSKHNPFFIIESMWDGLYRTGAAFFMSGADATGGSGERVEIKDGVSRKGLSRHISPHKII